MNRRNDLASERRGYKAATFLFSRVLDLYVTNTWRSWRSMGLTGGLVPWHSENHPAVARNAGPSLAWIAGDGGLPDGTAKAAWTAKDHNFFHGSTVHKQLALVNDHRIPQPYEVNWHVEIDGQRVAGERASGEIGVAENKLLPFSFALPSQGAARLDGLIVMTARIGPDEHRDEFAFSVFARVNAAPVEVAIYDPLGETTAMLMNLGITPRPWASGEIPATTLVIGRKALSATGAAVPTDLATFVRDGGRLLVMAQDPSWIRYALQLRTAEHVARRVFAIDARHPVCNGLTDANLSNWSGAGTLVPARSPLYMVESAPAYGWRWGRRAARGAATR